MRQYNQHEFYCINCGQRNIPLARQDAQKREKFHRKKMYCYHCKKIVNNIECKNDSEIYEFRTMFINGDFQKEAEESLKECNA